MCVSVPSTPRFFLLVAGALLITSSVANAQSVAAPPIRVGCINLSYIASKSKQGQLAFAQLGDLTKKKDSELAERAKLLEAQQVKLERERASMTAEARTDLERLFQKTRLEFDRFKQDTQTEVQQFAEKVERELQSRLFPVVDQLSREKGLDLVFTADSPGLIWFSRAVDMSDEVVQRLDSAK